MLTKFWWGTPERKTPLGRAKIYMENNIKVVLKEIGWEDMEQIDQSRDWYQWPAVVTTVMNILVYL